MEGPGLQLAFGQEHDGDCAEAGFAHPSHMARCVRRVLGLSPAQTAGRSARPPG